MTHPLLLEARRIGAERKRKSSAYTGPALPFTHLGNDREADMPWLSHEEAAGTVRMLMRDQLDHEEICCMARDRILHLAQENERLRAALDGVVERANQPSAGETELLTKISDMHRIARYARLPTPALTVKDSQPAALSSEQEK